MSVQDMLSPNTIGNDCLVGYYPKFRTVLDSLNGGTLIYVCAVVQCQES